MFTTEIPTGQAKSGKYWVARITGTVEEHEFNFAKVGSPRKGTAVATVTEAGVYRCSDGDVVLVAGDGSATVIERDDLSDDLIAEQPDDIAALRHMLITGQLRTVATFNARPGEDVTAALAAAFGDRFAKNLPIDQLAEGSDRPPAGATTAQWTIDGRWVPGPLVKAHGLAAVLADMGLTVEQADPREAALAEIRALMARHGITAEDLG